jgi:hypothetical protein
MPALHRGQIALETAGTAGRARQSSAFSGHCEAWASIRKAGRRRSLSQSPAPWLRASRLSPSRTQA